MQNEVQRQKAALRKEVKARMTNLSAEERAKGSLAARKRLAEASAWIQARSVLFYAPLRDEVDLWPLLREALQAGKEVALPRYVAARNQYEACRILNVDHDLEIGRFGIREPKEDCGRIVINRLDLIMVPGVAFDLQGRRLGRGKGFYDQLLAASRGRSCGVAFDDQLVREIPIEPHDILVNCILTPTRWLEF
jgi:5-formyltetrahydrofolate cyclo-ligase